MATATTANLSWCLDTGLAREQDRRDDAVLAGHQKIGRWVEPCLVVVLVRGLDLNCLLPGVSEGQIALLEPLDVLVGCVWVDTRTAILAVGRVGTHGLVESKQPPLDDCSTGVLNWRTPTSLRHEENTVTTRWPAEPVNRRYTAMPLDAGYQREQRGRMQSSDER
jgi:hypothetical protein